jgi:hypothetical protein
LPVEAANRQRGGRRLDVDWHDYQLAVRNKTLREFSAEAGVPWPTLVYARAGRPIRRTTLKRIVDGLLNIPVDPILVAALKPPEKKSAAVQEAEE